MREIVTSGLDRDQIKQESIEFADQFSDEIAECTELSEIEQISALRLLELEILKVVEQYYGDPDNQEVRDEGEEEVDMKIQEIQRAVYVTRELVRTKAAKIREEQR